MGYFEVKEDYFTGITEIDAQHCDLLTGKNGMLFSDRRNITVKNVASTLGLLIQHMKEQFSDEEKAMEYFEYAQLNGHRNQHQKLMDEAVKLHRRVYDPGMSAALLDELYCLFIKRYVNHIKEWDRICAVFVQKQTELEFKNLGLEDMDKSLLEILNFSDGSGSPA